MWSWLLNLIGLGKPTPVRLAQRLASPAPTVRQDALKTLTTLAEPWAIEMLLPLLADPDLSAAAKANLVARGPAIVPVVGGRIDRSDPATAKRLIDLLAEVPLAESAQTLLQALKYSQRPQQLAAKQALIRLGSVAVPVLEAARDEPNPWVQRQIEEVLAALQPTG